MNPPRFNVNDKVCDALGNVGRIVVRRRMDDGTFVYSVGFGGQRVSLTVLAESQLEPLELGWQQPGGTL